MAELSHDAHDDSFHEIQLSGKQLVFLFMATTVVSVVIFLCGVLVGRGVRADQFNETLAAAAPADVQASEGIVADTAPPPAADEPLAAPKPGELSYVDRLQSEKPPTERLSPATSAAADPTPALPPPPRTEPEPEKAPAPAVEPPPAATATAAADAPGPRPGTWAVQAVALRDRGAAADLVKRLAGKGYPAFLVGPGPNEPRTIYKVHVGRYRNRAEAAQVAARLKSEEKLQPWITR